MDQEKIGKFIAECRKTKNLTQEQLAEHLNISKNAVSKWERGLNLPDVSIMQDLCKKLDITLNELDLCQVFRHNFLSIFKLLYLNLFQFLHQNRYPVIYLV